MGYQRGMKTRELLWNYLRLFLVEYIEKYTVSISFRNSYREGFTLQSPVRNVYRSNEKGLADTEIYRGKERT